MTEPEPSLNGDTIDMYYIVQRPSRTELWHLHMINGGNYELVPTYPSGNTSNQRLYLTCSNSQATGRVETFDVSTGSFIVAFDIHNVIELNSINSMYNIPWRRGYFPRTTGIYSDSDFIQGYWIIPDNLNVASVSYPADLNVEPFVKWSSYPPAHNTYHSHLSEPVEDKYNRYFIIDDSLYWVSMRVNGAYVLKSDIKTELEVESYVADGQALGTLTTSSGLNQLIALGTETTYKDMAVYPVSFNSESFFDDKIVYLALYYTGEQTQLRLNLDQLAFVKAVSADKLYLEADIYVSSFNLEDGSYKSSRYYQFADFIAQHKIINIEMPNKISDFRCYGIDFLNVNASPVNLSDVLWQYDIEFAGWRDRMEQQLKAIYQALSGETVEIETYTQPSWNEDLSKAEPNTKVSDKELLSVFDSGFKDVKPSPEAQLSITSWVDMFSIPKLIAACCFALAMGTIILTLGKKKSD